MYISCQLETISRNSFPLFLLERAKKGKSSNFSIFQVQKLFSSGGRGPTYRRQRKFEFHFSLLKRDKGDCDRDESRERENTESNVFRVEHDEDGGEKHDGRTLTDPSRRFSSFSPFFTIYSETREKGSHPSKK